MKNINVQIAQEHILNSVAWKHGLVFQIADIYFDEEAAQAQPKLFARVALVLHDFMHDKRMSAFSDGTIPIYFTAALFDLVERIHLKLPETSWDVAKDAIKHQPQKKYKKGDPIIFESRVYNHYDNDTKHLKMKWVSWHEYREMVLYAAWLDCQELPAHAYYSALELILYSLPFTIVWSLYSASGIILWNVFNAINAVRGGATPSHILDYSNNLRDWVLKNHKTYMLLMAAVSTPINYLIYHILFAA